MSQILYRNIMVILFLATVLIVGLTINATNQMNRDLEQILIDMEEIEVMVLQMESETIDMLDSVEQLHNGVEELHPE